MRAEAETLLSVEALVCRYEQALALDRVSLEVRVGEIVRSSVPMARANRRCFAPSPD